MRNKKLIFSACWLLMSAITYSQRIQFSLATDISAVRSFKPQQQFTAIGQTIVVHFHFSPKEGAYAWYGYSGPGRFKNDFVATARSPLTQPQALDFKSYSQVSFRTLSFGWKHYLKGSFDAENSGNLYFTAGFGFVSGRAKNVYTIFKDTANYQFPMSPVDGSGRFKRLTLDAALGFEIPLGMSIFFYGEGRAWIPTTDYPSKYLLVNDDAPFIGTANVGLRVLFD